MPVDRILFHHLDGLRKGDVDSFEQPVITIGRASESDLSFDSQRERSVSAHHAVIRYDGGRFDLVDTHSTNGTYVNGRRIDRANLEDGDVIRFGALGPEVRVAIPSRMKERTLHDSQRLKGDTSEPAVHDDGRAPARSGGPSSLEDERVACARHQRFVRRSLALAGGVAAAFLGTTWTIIEGTGLEGGHRYFLTAMLLSLGGLAVTLVSSIYHGRPGRQRFTLIEILWLFMIAAVTLVLVVALWVYLPDA